MSISRNLGSMLKWVTVGFFLSLTASGLPSHQGAVFVASINGTELKLRTDTIYSIVNSATNLPLLHGDHELELERLSHWWTFVPEGNNIYYMQIQDTESNHSAPRFDRSVRFQVTSTGNYHLFPVSCPKYPDPLVPGSVLYADYFDEYDRDQTECVHINSTKADWITKLENEDVGGIPKDFLSKANFEYKIEAINSFLEAKLMENPERAVEFVAHNLNSTNKEIKTKTILEDLNFKEKKVSEVANFWESGSEFICECGNLEVKRPYFTFELPAKTPFRVILTLSKSIEAERLEFEGFTRNRIANEILLSDVVLKINLLGHPGLAEADVVWLNHLGEEMLGLQRRNETSNYLLFDPEKIDYKFLYHSSESKVSIGLEESENGCGCHRVSVFWTLLVISFVVSLLLLLMAIVLATTLWAFRRAKSSLKPESNNEEPKLKFLVLVQEEELLAE